MSEGDIHSWGGLRSHSAMRYSNAELKKGMCVLLEAWAHGSMQCSTSAWTITLILALYFAKEIVYIALH